MVPQSPHSFIQNTDPVNVAPDQGRVRAAFYARICVSCTSSS